jgi:hypothetical protein
MRHLLFLLGSACSLLMSCSVCPVSNEVPQVELIPKVTAEHIHLRAVLHSRSTRSVALVDHYGFVTLNVSSAVGPNRFGSCAFIIRKRADWNQVKMLSADQPLILETSIPYHRMPNGWLLSNSASGRSQVDYLTWDRQLKATFRYSVDRKSLPRFWWLSGKRFLASPLEKDLTFQLKP